MEKEQNIMNGQITVKSIGMDARKDAALRMAFKIYQKRKYRLLEKGAAEQPDVVIADLDTAEGIQAARNFLREFPHKPILGLSISPVGFSEFMTIRKPIQMETLFPALEKLLATSGSPVEEPRTVMPRMSPIVEQTSRPIPSNTVEMVNVPRPSPQTVYLDKIQYFDPQEGLLGHLELVARDKIPSSVIDESGKVLWRLLPAENLVETILSQQDATKTLSESHKLRVSEIRAFSSSAQAVRRETVGEFMWTVSHIVANGRLSKRIPLNKPIKLKQWPNLTRLSPLPEAVRLSAFFARSPASPALTLKMLNIAPESLFNYLAAADSLGIIQYQSDTTAKPATRNDGVESITAGAGREEPKKVTKRGLLGRLLAKITGL